MQVAVLWAAKAFKGEGTSTKETKSGFHPDETEQGSLFMHPVLLRAQDLEAA